jgi:hypothetical protein
VGESALASSVHERSKVSDSSFAFPIRLLVRAQL